MKFRQHTAWFICLAALFSTLFLFSAKKPVFIRSASGTMPYQYSVVNTVITMDPTKIAEGEVGPKPLITRGVKGTFGGKGQKTSTRVDVPLKVPEKEIKFNVTELTSAATKIAGACNPRAGLVAGAASIIIDAGMQIAGAELTKFYGKDPLTLTMIEIVPNQYYRIDTDTNSVELTEQFAVDFKRYNQILTDLIPAAEKFNNLKSRYTQEWNKLNGGRTDAEIERLERIYADELMPAFRRTIELQAELQKYPLHRFIIMVVNTPEGVKCKAGGAGKGPWHIFVYILLGARQTNVFEVDYCVPSTTKDQQFNVELQPTIFDPAIGQLQPGGIRLTAADNISFPVEDAPGIFDYKNKETNLFSVWEELITGAQTYEAVLFPFDINKMRNEYQKEVQEEKTKQTEERSKVLDDAIEIFNKYKNETKLSSSEQEKTKEPKDVRALTESLLETTDPHQILLAKLPDNKIMQVDNVRKALTAFDQTNLITNPLSKPAVDTWNKMLSDIQSWINKNASGLKKQTGKLVDLSNNILSTLKANYGKYVSGKAPKTITKEKVEAELKNLGFPLSGEAKGVIFEIDPTADIGFIASIFGGKKDDAKKILVAVAMILDKALKKTYENLKSLPEREG